MTITTGQPAGVGCGLDQADAGGAQMPGHQTRCGGCVTGDADYNGNNYLESYF